MRANPGFGELSEAYDLARKKYMQEVIDYILSYKIPKSAILDVGCGTGISTRQLAAHFPHIEGCDIDEKMIQKALEHKTPNIIYKVAPVNKLPFFSSKFGLVTAFGAFHWFCDSSSIREIKRVLCDEGYFIVVNKYGLGNFRAGYKKIVEELSGESIEDVMDYYNPKEILKENNFKDVSSRSFIGSDIFTEEEAFVQMQSMSLYKFIPSSFQEQGIQKLREYARSLCKNGKVEREMETNVIIVKK